MKVMVWQSRGKIKGNFQGGKVPAEFIQMVGYALGRFVVQNLKEGVDVMDSLREVSEEVLIPAYLEGAGCRKVKEE